MPKEWQELSKMTDDKEVVINRVTLKESGIAVEGEFSLPPLATLSYDDQVFVAMFIKVHGSIKEMEQVFGVSYPTIKGRLNRMAEKLGFLQVKQVDKREDLLKRLERGEIGVDEALEGLSQ